MLSYIHCTFATFSRVFRMRIRNDVDQSLVIEQRIKLHTSPELSTFLSEWGIAHKSLGYVHLHSSQGREKNFESQAGCGRSEFRLKFCKCLGRSVRRLERSQGVNEMAGRRSKASSQNRLCSCVRANEANGI